jgi:NAD(P)-dependent dehydrogenase (short-subunit alcohol dehydrogenase family)
MSKNFGERTTAVEVVEGHDLTGKEVIVTGANSGIGVETARALAKAGARVVIAARDLKKANEVKDDIIKTTGNNNVEVEELELGSLKSVDKFVERYLATKKPLHILINNAGIMNTPQGVTEDGFELQFGVNHVGHFALTVGLLPALKAAKNSRVVMVSSLAHRYSDVIFDDIHFKKRPYEGYQSYG